MNKKYQVGFWIPVLNADFHAGMEDADFEELESFDTLEEAEAYLETADKDAVINIRPYAPIQETK